MPEGTLLVEDRPISYWDGVEVEMGYIIVNHLRLQRTITRRDIAVLTPRVDQ